MERKLNKETSILKCENLNKSFFTKDSEFNVIKDISFDVQENEFLVLFGPGQCGKTTLINMMSGLDQPTSGKIYHNDVLVTAPHHSRAVVYQEIVLFPWMTVNGNVGFGPKVRMLGREECAQRTQHYIDLVGLTGFENAFPCQLSGGMKQRVGIARAYSNEPDIMFLDEPFGHLDAQTRYMMQESLEKIWQKEKRTVVFVTNNLEEAIFLADKIILFSDCPTLICDEFVIDLPRPRNITDPEFLQIRKHITSAIEENEIGVTEIK